MIGIRGPENKVNQATKAWSKLTKLKERIHFKGDILVDLNNMSKK